MGQTQAFAQDSNQLVMNGFLLINGFAEFGITKGYLNDNLNQSCLKQTDPPRITEIEDGQKINRPFSIITLNVMGICRKPEQTVFAKLRAKLLRKEILEKQPDILCFQEMSQSFLDFFYKSEIREIYPYVYENPIVTEGKKDIDCCIISKFKPTKIIMQNLDGVLNYRNTLQIIEFENLVIFNCYLQAGSKASPGQITKWMHYSRCRAQYFDYIKKIIKKYKHKGIIFGSVISISFELNIFNI
jgi:exonuclease III